MDSNIWLYGIVFLPSGIMIILGLIYMPKKDWAWRITSSLLRLVLPQRTYEWEFFTQRSMG